MRYHTTIDVIKNISLQYKKYVITLDIINYLKKNVNVHQSCQNNCL